MATRHIAQFDLFAGAASLPLFSRSFSDRAVPPPPSEGARASNACPGAPPPPAPLSPPAAATGFETIAGQDCAKRVLEIALAGGHNILFRADGDVPLAALSEATAGVADALGFPTDMRPTIFLTDADCPAARADLNLDLVPTSDADLLHPPPCESSAVIAERVRAARIVIDRWLAEGEAELDPPAERLFDQAVSAMGLDEQRQGAVREVAFTIAALAAPYGAPPRLVGRVHLAEALAYALLRPLRGA